MRCLLTADTASDHGVHGVFKCFYSNSLPSVALHNSLDICLISTTAARFVMQ